MRHSSLVTTITLAGALAFGTVPALAQRGGGGHGGGGHGGGGSGHAGGGGGHVGGGQAAGAPPGGGMRGGGHVFSPGAGVPRGSAGVRGGTFSRGGTFDHGSGGWHGHGLGRSWGWASSFYYPPYPYYPNYPYYPYPYPSGSSVAPPWIETPDTRSDETVGAAAGQLDQSNFGGLSFDITPSNAQVFVDGNYVGPAGEFTPATQPLGLPSGRHHVELRGAGYKTLSFDVDVVAGQVIPYEGQMER